MNRFNQTVKKTILALVCAGTIAALLAGCVTTNKTVKTDVFFPPPPDEPRLQFLTGFSSERSFRQREDKSLMTFLTGEKAAAKELNKPYGAVAYDKKIFVCDTAMGSVLVIDLQTERMGMLEAKGEGRLVTPLNIAIDRADGTAYVADSTREQVVIFDKQGNYLAAMGKKDEMRPRDVAVGADRIYIADLKGHNVRVFNKTTREFLFAFPQGPGATNEQTGLYMPLNLALDTKGRLYVSDTGGYRVQVYDGDGKYLRSVGEQGDGLGMFARLKGIAVDYENRLYAADAMSQVVQIFDEQGKLLCFFGDPGEGPRIQILPTKVLVDYEDVGYFQKYAAPNFEVEHLVLVINQLGPHKVAVYGFGHKRK